MVDKAHPSIHLRKLCNARGCKSSRQRLCGLAQPPTSKFPRWIFPYQITSPHGPHDPTDGWKLWNNRQQAAWSITAQHMLRLLYRHPRLLLREGMNECNDWPTLLGHLGRCIRVHPPRLSMFLKSSLVVRM